MADNSNYSKIDPELATILAGLPPPPPDDNPTVESRRERYRLGVLPKAKQNHEPFLPKSDEYTVIDRQIEVEQGVTVNARCITPTPREGEDGLFPLLFWMHGGGWIASDANMDDYNLRRTSVDLRISVVNFEYRLAPENPFPTAPNDCFAGLKYVATHPEVFSASLKKGFIVGGPSAGGNLSAIISYKARDDPTHFASKGTPVTGQLLQIPALCHPKAFPEKYKSSLVSMEQNKDAPGLNKAAAEFVLGLYNPIPEDPAMSPMLLPSHKGLPPAFIQVCGLDPLRDEGIVYKQILEEAGVPVKLEVYPGVPHIFDTLFPTLAQSKKYIQDFRNGLRWLISQTAA
ncbi:alpha/beta-hydrolase [Marasmius fiardii PR-910]|nr:alpha/beta-hydrolase [Marasmius fiardii PR-910]